MESRKPDVILQHLTIDDDINDLKEKIDLNDGNLTVRNDQINKRQHFLRIKKYESIWLLTQGNDVQKFLGLIKAYYDDTRSHHRLQIDNFLSIYDSEIQNKKINGLQLDTNLEYVLFHFVKCFPQNTLEYIRVTGTRNHLYSLLCVVMHNTGIAGCAFDKTLQEFFNENLDCLIGYPSFIEGVFDKKILQDDKLFEGYDRDCLLKALFDLNLKGLINIVRNYFFNINKKYTHFLHEETTMTMIFSSIYPYYPNAKEGYLEQYYPIKDLEKKLGLDAFTVFEALKNNILKHSPYSFPQISVGVIMECLYEDLLSSPINHELIIDVILKLTPEDKAFEAFKEFKQALDCNNSDHRELLKKINMKLYWPSSNIATFFKGCRGTSSSLSQQVVVDVRNLICSYSIKLS